MLHLLGAALLWAFSFGLIKDRLAGLDANFIAAARLLVSLIFFLPWLRPGRLTGRLQRRLLFTGAVQYGLMYLTYVAAFRHLQAHQVALFTIFTPIFVTVVDDLFERRFSAWNLLIALLAVLGTGIVAYGGLGQGQLLRGALLVQVSNLCFAFGQVAYRRWAAEASLARDLDGFALLFLGGFASAGLAAGLLTDWSALQLSSRQLLTLLYLGAVASGLGFFLWNHGARRVEVGALAVFNNLKIPLAVAVSLLCFGERAAPGRLIGGGLLVLGALGLHQHLLARRRASAALPAAGQIEKPRR